jgi:LEA14-like dessication related protein
LKKFSGLSKALFHAGIASLLASIALCSCVGCTTVGSWFMEKPKVSLSEVKIKDLSLAGATAVFSVRVQNPNPFSMKVRTVRYNLELGGKPLSSGKIEEGAEVQPHSETTVEVPVPFQFGDLMTSALGFIKTGKTQYRLSGEAKVSFMTLPFDEKGELNLN